MICGVGKSPEDCKIFEIADHMWVAVTPEYDYLCTIETFCRYKSCLCSDSRITNVFWTTMIPWRRGVYEKYRDNLENNPYTFEIDDEIEVGQEEE